MFTNSAHELGESSRSPDSFWALRDERGIYPLIVRHFDDKFLANKGIDF
jgi:hypothetical protein